jgi:hypothetical protein
MKLEWLEREVEIGSLVDYKHNPRTISKKAFERLVQSIKQDGYHARIVIDDNYNILAGHQRKKALLSAGWLPTDKIKVLYPSRPLSQKEFARINIRDNLEFGDFDMDILANNFDMDFLKETGMEFAIDMPAPLDLDEAKLDDCATDKLCKKCPYRENE